MEPRAFIGSLNEKPYLDQIRDGLEFIGFAELVQPDSRVFLKPNLTFPTYRPGIMTSPEAVEAAIVAIREYTPNLTVGDSDGGGYGRFSMDEVYGEIGMYDLGKKYDVSVVNVTHLPRRRVVVEDGRKPLELNLPVLLLDETDLLVTMPVPKIHMYAGVSLGFKNQWGCIPEPNDRLRLHPDFERTVLAVNELIHSQVSIVDGQWGLNVSGPVRGEEVRLDWLLVTNALGAGERICCDLMQVPLERARHLVLAEKRGLVPPLDAIRTNRDISGFRRERFHLRKEWTDYPGNFAFRSKSFAWLAYFSPLARILHKLLYLFREPFYDYWWQQEKSGDRPGR